MNEGRTNIGGANQLPVVIAGAGPTGLMCALALGKQGIPVIVLEAEGALARDLRARADGEHPRQRPEDAGDP